MSVTLKDLLMPFATRRLVSVHAFTVPLDVSVINVCLVTGDFLTVNNANVMDMLMYVTHLLESALAAEIILKAIVVKGISFSNTK